MTNQLRVAPVPENRSNVQAVSFLTGIVKSLVTVPDQVHVEAETTEKATTLFLRVAPVDVPKLLDHGGRTVHSLKTVLTALSVRSSLKVSLDIVVVENDI